MKLEQLIIRDACIDEAKELTSIAISSKQVWGYSDEFMMQCRAELSIDDAKLKEPRYHHRVALQGTTILGFYTLEYLSPGKWEVEALFVSPPFIGKGIGQSLWQDLKAQVVMQGGGQLIIASDPHALPFYLKMGAEQVGAIASQSIQGRELPLLQVLL